MDQVMKATVSGIRFDNARAQERHQAIQERHDYKPECISYSQYNG
jgi:hypothetical protein